MGAIGRAIFGVSGRDDIPDAYCQEGALPDRTNNAGEPLYTLNSGYNIDESPNRGIILEMGDTWFRDLPEVSPLAIIAQDICALTDVSQGEAERSEQYKVEFDRKDIDNIAKKVVRNWIQYARTHRKGTEKAKARKKIDDQNRRDRRPKRVSRQALYCGLRASKLMRGTLEI